MKVIAINGSAHADGNTHQALEIVVKELKDNGIETEIIDLVKMNINPFTFGDDPKLNDDMILLKDKVVKAQGLILGSPTYYSNVSSRMQMFIERLGALTSGDDLKGKVGASVAVARRQGANFVYAAMNYFFGIKQMVIATSSYWNNIVAKEPGKIKEDKEGIETLKKLGKNMAELLIKLNK